MQAEPIKDDAAKPATLPGDEKPADGAAKPADGAAADEPPNPTDQADDATEDGKKPEDGAAKPESVVPNPLDKVGPLPAEKIAASFEDPEFAAAMEKQGYSKEQLVETARNAALAQEFVAVAGTPKAAQFAAQAADHFYDIEEGFTAVKDLKSFDDFMVNTMLPLSYVLDEKGQPIKNADGSFKTDGTVAKFLETNYQYEARMIEHITSKMPQDNDDVKDVQAALEILQNFRKNGYKVGPPPVEMTPEQKAREAELQQREQELDKGTKAQRAAAVEKFETRITEATDKELDTLIGATVNNSALSPALQAKAKDAIYEGLVEKLGKNRTFKAMARQARAHGMSEEVLSSIVALNTSTLKAIYHDVASKVMQDFGVAAVKQNQDTREKTDAQLAADRINPKVGTTTGKPGRTTLTADQIEQQAADEVLKENGGKRPADYSSKLLMKIMQIEAKQNPLHSA